MKRAVWFAILFLVCSPAAAGMNEGVAALQKGDYATAWREFRPLAEAGDARAQFNVALLYAEGRGTAQNDAEAAKWYRRSAEQGNAAAQNNLGALYNQGRGVDQNPAEAVNWFRKAAEQGISQAQLNLGLALINGRGVTKNAPEAAALLARAAKQGEPNAQNALGALYENGDGLEKDAVQAYVWFNLAASRLPAGAARDRATASRDRVVKLLTAAQRAQGQQIAAAFQPKSEIASVAAPSAPAAVGPSADLVRSVQAMLAGLGYDPGAADGTFGAKTRAAISAFQERVALPVDGQISTPLLARLRDAATAAGLNVPGQASRSTAVLPPNVRPQQPATQERPRTAGPTMTGSGSGIVISRDGHILTNNHVILGCQEVRARPPGAAAAVAVAVVAFNQGDDLALLKLPSPAPGFARFRDGTTIRAGEDVVVVGYPLRGLLSSDASVTTGAVSALSGLRDDARYLQITAPVQPGNSGGPLLDMSGSVVGVVVSKLNALKIAQTTGDIPQNVNFAIKTATARKFLDANRVPYETARGGAEMRAADIGDLARGFTLSVECWK